MDYLFPANPIAISIITFLIGFFSVWLFGLIWYWRWLRAEQKHIENNENIQPLVTTRDEQDHGHENSDQKADPENVFSNFCQESSLNSRSPLTKHLKAIFLAGWNETRLEVGELINHTTADLFKWNNLFRSMLAVFIVIGLFGTLFGLADSITELTPALKERAANEISTENSDLEGDTANKIPTDNNKKMTQALGDLLEKMKGALAPSIGGIFFTILGVILYGIFLQSACHPVKSSLERLTLTVWVPQLYPTTPQKPNQTIQKIESQMQKGLETAAQFSESVQKVHGNIDEFNESLAQVREITQPLSNSVTQINKAASDISTAADTLNTSFTENLDQFSKEFTSSVTHLTGFQDEIRNLHEQFQDAANQKLDQQIETLNKQDQNLTTIVEVLKNCEKLYVEACQQIDNTLQKFLNKTAEVNANIEINNRKFLEEINDTNREWITEIQVQLKTELAVIQPTLEKKLGALTSQLTSDLNGVQGTLDEGLSKLTDQLKFFQLPIEKTADQIEGTIESFTRIMEGIVNDLQSEFQKQNETIKQQNESYEEQLTGVKNLNKSVENLLNQLDESSNNQKEAVDSLSGNVSELTKDIKNLDTAIKTFTSDSGDISQSIGAIKGYVEVLGNASQELVQKADVTPLNANIGTLNTTIEQISQNSQVLANAVNQLTKQIDLSRTSEPERNKKERSRFSKLNPFSRRKKNGR